MRRLNGEQIQVIYYIEQYYLKNSKFPPVGVFLNRFPFFDLKFNLEADELFVEALNNRGIVVPIKLDEPSDIPREITPEQVAAITSVINFEDKRSRASKLRSLGIEPSKWSAWIRNPTFKNFLHSLSVQNLEGSLHVAHEGILKSVEKGNIDAIKFYLEWSGHYKPEEEGANNNYKLVISRLIESIQRWVKDPDILSLIGNDFDLVMKGLNPSSVVNSNSVSEKKKMETIKMKEIEEII